MKKIMILGAGIYQVPLIRKAKELGFETVVVSIPGNYPGFKEADIVYYENTVDSEKVLQIAEKEGITGICTAGTDVAIISLGIVCDALGIPGLSENAARITTDKMLMKEAFKAHGVSTAPFEEVKVDADMISIEKVCESISYPVIFKAVDSSGSRGITKVESKADIPRAYKNIMGVTKRGFFLIEKYLIGEEYGAQAFVQNGIVEFVMPHGDYVFQGDTGVPIGHYVPYGNEQLIEKTQSELKKAIEAMGLDNCAINADFILVDDIPYVLEIGARSGATGLAEETSIYYGFDYYEKIIKVATGENVSFVPQNEKREANIVKLLYSDADGRITSILNDNDPDDHSIDVQFDYSEGECVRKFKVGPDRIGQVIVRDDSITLAEQKMERVLSNIRITIE